jgi:hypothetical protein
VLVLVVLFGSSFYAGYGSFPVRAQNTNYTIGLWMPITLNDSSQLTIDFQTACTLSQMESALLTIRNMGFTYIIAIDDGFRIGYDYGDFGGSALAEIWSYCASIGLKIEVSFQADTSTATWGSYWKSLWGTQFSEMGAWLTANNLQNYLQGICFDDPKDYFQGTFPSFAVFNSFVRNSIGLGNDVNMYYDAESFDGQAFNWSQYGTPDAHTFLGSYDYYVNWNNNICWQGLLGYNNNYVNDTCYSTGTAFPILCCYQQAWNSAELGYQINYCVQNGNMTQTIQYFSWDVGDNAINTNPSQWAGITEDNNAYINGQTDILETVPTPTPVPTSTPSPAFVSQTPNPAYNSVPIPPSLIPSLSTPTASPKILTPTPTPKSSSTPTTSPKSSFVPIKNQKNTANNTFLIILVTIVIAFCITLVFVRRGKK